MSEYDVYILINALTGVVAGLPHERTCWERVLNERYELLED